PQPDVESRARAVDRERGAPDARAKNGDALAHSRSPAFAPTDASARTRIGCSVPRRMRRTLARCRNRINDPLPKAAATIGPGAPDSTAAEGSATVATTDPSEITREIQTTTRNATAAATVAIGASTPKTPAATATPLP